jgi:peptide/nickel transport system substrate-binding protein
VKFHDGEPIDATSRQVQPRPPPHDEGLVPQAGDRRRSTVVEVVDPLTIKLNLKAPFSPLLAQLTDRAGMMVSPKAAEAEGRQVRPPSGLRRSLQVRRAGPAGPHRRREVRRLLEQGPGLHRQDHLPADRRRHGAAGQPALGRLDLIERVLATDIKTVRDNPKLRLSKAVSLGWFGIMINVEQRPKAEQSARQGPARAPGLRAASLDRDAINQVVFNGEFVPGNQWVSPQNPYYQEKFPVPKRDIAKAKALLKEAGVTTPLTLDFMVPNGPENRAVAEVVQSMAAEAGFDLKIRSPSSRPRSRQARTATTSSTLNGWSGRSDPDGNSLIYQTCKRAAEHGPVLRQGGRCAAQRGAPHQSDPRRAQGSLREDHRQGPGRRGDGSSISITRRC